MVPSSALSGIVILGKVPVLTFDVLSSTYTVTPFVASSNPPCPEFPQYIKRVISLAKDNYEIHTIAFFVKISKALAQQYYDLYKTMDIVPHRKKELDELLKKTTVQP